MANIYIYADLGDDDKDKLDNINKYRWCSSYDGFGHVFCFYLLF